MAPAPKPSKPLNSETQADRARRHAQRGLIRQAAWGGAAAVALMALAFASQTETGSRRLQMAFAGGSGDADSTARAAAAEHRADEAQAEVRRLAAEVHKLAADRERLNTRLAGIERDFEDLTGSIGQQPAQTAAPIAAPAPTTFAPLTLPGGVPALAPWPDPTPQPKPPTVAKAETAAPADLSAPRRIATIAVKRPPEAIPAPTKTEPPPPAKTAAAPVATSTPPAVRATPEKVSAATVAPKPTPVPTRDVRPGTITVAPLPAARAKPAPKPAPKPVAKVEVPMPPVRMAALPQRRPTVPSKRAFGIDISGASSIALLRARWGEVKARFGPQVAGLHPLIARDRHAGHLPYRLVIGPLPSAAAAAKLCGQFGLSRSRCRPTRFVGNPLAKR